MLTNVRYLLCCLFVVMVEFVRFPSPIFKFILCVKRELLLSNHKYNRNTLTL